MPTPGTIPEELKSSNVTRICGQDELLAADVVTRSDGKNAICTESTLSPQQLSNTLKLNWQELNLTLTTSYQTVFTKNGSGLLLGFVVDCNSNLGINFEFTVDGLTVFTELSMDFMTNIYGTNYGDNIFLYIGRSDLGDLQFRPPYPIKYSSNITVRAKRTATSKIVNRFLYWTQE